MADFLTIDVYRDPIRETPARRRSIRAALAARRRGCERTRSAGRAAFYAAARQIYLDEPHGEKGFWPRLRTLQPDALFVWGRRDKLVPIGFARHVAEALPRARQLELDCGHVPQVERPEQTHDALAAFLSEPARAVAGTEPLRPLPGT